MPVQFGGSTSVKLKFKIGVLSFNKQITIDKMLRIWGVPPLLFDDKIFGEIWIMAKIRKVVFVVALKFDFRKLSFSL